MKIRMLNILTIIVLSTLLIIRFFSKDENGWISCLNYVGFVIAVCGFLFSFSSRHKKNKAANFIKGILFIIVVFLMILGCFIFTGNIALDVLINDEILLATLLISLPSNYYCELLDKFVIKQSEKENKNGIRR